MSLPDQYATSLALEQFLGDPFDPGSLCSFKRAVERDEQECYPGEAVTLLNEWGLHEYYIPAQYGGKLSSYEELYSLLRLVARRDFTVALTHSTSCIASFPCWVIGNQEQKHRLAEIIKNKEQVAIGFHEKEHGNDLLACEVRAKETTDGFVLSGEKWVIGNPRRCSTLILFARTAEKGGPRGFSLLLLEKKLLSAESFAYLRKFKTHGVRGHEISGIRFDEARVCGWPVLGTAGLGLEAALIASQVTRVLATALCLGAVDTALRVTLKFALSRTLYGSTVLAIPQAKAALAESYVDLLFCECMAIVAARGLHVVTDQMSLIACVAKYIIPTVIDRIMGNLSVVLGARHYLREGHCWGVFQKIMRDIPFTGVSHYSSVINLSHLAPQLFSLHERSHERPEGGEVERERAALFNLWAPLPPFDAARLALANRGSEVLWQGLEATLSKLEAGARLSINPEVGERLKGLLAALTEEGEQLAARVRAVSRAGQGQRTAVGFEAARRYALLAAAAAAVQLWATSGARLGGYIGRGEWLVMVLERVRRRFAPWREMDEMPYVEEAAAAMVEAYETNRLFSILPLHLAGATQRGVSR